jgi:hypothetical protein
MVLAAMRLIFSELCLRKNLDNENGRIGPIRPKNQAE